MLLRCGLLLAILSCVQPKAFHRDGLLAEFDNDFNGRFSLWPSVHNGATLLRIRREGQAEKSLAVEAPASAVDTQGPSEGIGGEIKPPTDPPTPVPPPSKVQEENVPKLDTPPASDANIPVEQQKNASEISNKTPKGRFLYLIFKWLPMVRI